MARREVKLIDKDEREKLLSEQLFADVEVLVAESCRCRATVLNSRDREEGVVSLLEVEISGDIMDVATSFKCLGVFQMGLRSAK